MRILAAAFISALQITFIVVVLGAIYMALLSENTTTVLIGWFSISVIIVISIYRGLK